MNKRSIRGEFLAKCVLEDTFDLPELEMGEAPDLHTKDLGIDVTNGVNENEIRIASITICSRRINSEEKEFEYQKENILNSFRKKLNKRYGYKKNAIYIHSDLDMENEVYNKQVFDTLLTENIQKDGPVYNYVFILNEYGDKLMICDFDNESYEIKSVNVKKYYTKLDEFIKQNELK